MPVAYPWKRCVVPILATLTLAALVGMPSHVYAMVGDVPGMPQSESSDPGSMSGLPNTGGDTSPGGSTSPPATSEPMALLSGLLGCGLTGAYAFCRRRSSSGSAAEPGEASDPVARQEQPGGPGDSKGSNS